MNNYVNKENAIGLKEIGFQEETIFYFMPKEKAIRHFGPANHNYGRCVSISAPDFLSAADWLLENHSMEFEFRPNRTRIFCHITGDWIGKFGEVYDDHRNAAIAHTITIVKERKK